MRLEEFKTRLRGVRGKTALCPAHNDHINSLSFDQGDDGKILLHCHAGCTTEEIVSALGLKIKDLFPEPGWQQYQARYREIKDIYDYHDKNGRLLFQVCRTTDKRFFQRRPDGCGGFIKGLGDLKPVLYRLPELLSALDSGEVVYVVEGEKDADNLARLGLAATTNPMGAGKWRDYYSSYFPVGVNVVIFPDNDLPGRKHADQVAASLKARGCRARVVLLPGLPEKGDVSDWLADGHNKEELLEIVARGTDNITQQNPVGNRCYTAAELMSMEFDEPNFIIPGRLTVGAALLCGPPKLGKSWYCLGLGLSYAEAFDVLYLALEDTPRRLKNRLGTVLNGRAAPENLYVYTSWPRLDEGGIQQLNDFLDKNPNCKLVMVDTLAKVRHTRGKNTGLYEDDYRAITELKTVADKHGVAIIAVHHVNKTKPTDILETVSGTTGLTGAADTIMILGRERGRSDGTLFITGRDVEEAELAMRFDTRTCTWKEVGEAQDYRISKERQEILEVMRLAGKPLSPKDVAKALGKNESTIKNLIYAMKDCHLIKQISHGKYVHHSLYSLPEETPKIKGSEGIQKTMAYAEHSLFKGETGQETTETIETIKTYRLQRLYKNNNILDTGVEVYDVNF